MKFKLGLLLYILSGLVQWSAVTGLLNHLLGDAWFFITWIPALFVAGIPVIGAIAGVTGAILRWGWPWWLALFMAFSHFVGLGLMAAKAKENEE